MTSGSIQPRKPAATAARTALLAEVLVPLGHELNNAFSVILGSLDLLAEECPDGGEAQALLDDALDASREAAALVERLVASVGLAPVDRHPVDARGVVDRVAALLRASLPPAIELETACAVDLPPVSTDAPMLESALLELAINAREAMPDGGRLEISATPSDDAIAFTVGDSGPGIPSADRERVFDPFFTTRYPPAGRGLGLGVVRGFCARSGGHARLTCADGEGTRVTLTLPGVE